MRACVHAWNLEYTLPGAAGKECVKDMCLRPRSRREGAIPGLDPLREHGEGGVFSSILDSFHLASLKKKNDLVEFKP